MSGEDRIDLERDRDDEAVATLEPPLADRSGIDEAGAARGDAANLDLLMDVDMKLTVELGRARLKFREVLNLTAGSVVELAKLTSEPVDILVNGALLASGEVVVVDDHFAIRITKLLNRVERLKRVL
jgi:flagellar motor switch protein FliN/FliY